MEKLALRAASTATVPTLQFPFQVQHSLFPFTTFLRNPTESPSQLCCRSRHRHAHAEAFATKQAPLLVHEEVQEEGEGEAPYLDDDMSILSLSEKPDRNMALLDDYETEELDFDCGPNHRSGSSPLSFAQKTRLRVWFFCSFEILFLICSE